VIRIARFVVPMSARRNPESVMPSGSMMRFRASAPKSVPLAALGHVPASATAKFEYEYALPGRRS
jgi:hypothetical protein